MAYDHLGSGLFDIFAPSIGQEEEGKAPLFCTRIAQDGMITQQQATALVEEALKGTSNYLVGVEVRPGGKVIVEVDKDPAITLGELAALNKQLRAGLDEIGEDCELQVSSPGMGNPFKVMRQYHKHTGRLVKVQLVDGKDLEGRLEKVDEAEVLLRIQHPSKVKGRPPKLDDEPMVIPFDRIRATKASIKFN